MALHVAAVCGVGEPGDTEVLAGLTRGVWAGSILEKASLLQLVWLAISFGFSLG